MKLVERKVLIAAISALLHFLREDSLTWSDEKWAKFEDTTGMKRLLLQRDTEFFQ